jgi:hypothetical protein
MKRGKKDRTDSPHANLGTWYYDKSEDVRRKIRRQKYHQNKYDGTYIEYEYLIGRSPYDVENDYKILVSKKCQGLTRVGQKLFQQSIEAFVYSVRGAHAKTRWSITGQGLQTQEVFRKVVKDTILSGQCHRHHFQHADGHFQYPRHPKFCNHAGSSSYPLGSKDFDGTHSGIQQCPDGGWEWDDVRKK